MSDRQAIILQSLKDKSNNNVVQYVRDVKETFDIETLCEILNINRNRYNYLKKHGGLDWYIAQLGGFVL